MFQSALGPAYPFEYRYRLAILLLSQPVFAFLCFSTTGLSGQWYAPEFSAEAGIAAVLLAAAGVFLRVWATSFMTAAVMSSKHPNTDQLVCQGPYASSRNPLYVGTMLIFAGYGVFFGWGAALAYAVFHWLRYERIIRYEESQLRARWGNKFDDFCRRVPRWLPSSPAQMSLKGPFVSRDGIWGNSIFIGIAVGLAASAWTGSLLALIPVELAGGLIAGVYVLSLKQSAVLSRQSDAPHTLSVYPTIDDDDTATGRKVA